MTNPITAHRSFSFFHQDLIRDQPFNNLGMKCKSPRTRRFLSRWDKDRESEPKKQLMKEKKLGHWVILENCHLSKTWMPELEKKIQQFAEDAEGMDKKFRLWLTSKPDPSFPVSVLQNGVKVTTEPPRGVKANLKGIFSSKNDEFFSGCKKVRAFHKLTWALSYFHAII